MARMVTLWRCKCGTRIKVVAETGSIPSASQTASCPTCREPHTVHADKIISVIEDMSERSPALAHCEERERLLVAQNKALDLYRRGAKELAEAAGMMADGEFQFLYDKVLTARQSLLGTRRLLIEHTAEHGC